MKEINRTMRSIGREIATNPSKKPARSTARYFRYFRLRQSSLYLYSCLPFVRIYTHTYVQTHRPTRLIFHRLSYTLLPSSQLTFFRVARPTPRNHSNYVPASASVYVSLCKRRCADVYIRVFSYNSARRSASIKAARNPRISRQVKLDTSPNTAMRGLL